MKSLKLADRTITTNRPAFIMGIVNVTPDSFWEKSRGQEENVFEQIDSGADIIDIGGESTRPGSLYVSEEEEISRIVPVIKAVRNKSSVPISVDTRKLGVMRAAYDAGADIINDISAFEDDPSLAIFAAEKKIPVILMHKRGIPLVMQNQTSYDNVFNEVNQYLCDRVKFACNAGIEQNKIIVDPGIGFGKDTLSNSILIKRCGELCSSKYPVLMALSRKSCIGEMTGQSVENRLSGTLAADLIAVINGASLIRVHDVREAADTLAVLRALN